MPQSPKENTKQSYKLGTHAREDIITMLKAETKQQDIIDTIKKKYDVDITAGRLSQIKSQLILYQFGTYSKTVEKRLRANGKIDDNTIRIIDRAYALLADWLDGLDAGELTPRDALALSVIVTNAHKIYNEIHKEKESVTATTTAIRRELGLDEHTPQTHE